MKAWIRTNAIGFPLIVLIAGLILVTITWPSRSDNLGFRDPVQVIQIGQSADIEGARVQLAADGPSLAELQEHRIKGTDEQPPQSRLVIFAFDVTAGTMPEQDEPSCAPMATDGARRWSPEHLVSVTLWNSKHGDRSQWCQLHKRFVLGFFVPETAQITAIDLLLTPIPKGDAVTTTLPGQVIRFLVD